MNLKLSIKFSNSPGEAFACASSSQKQDVKNALKEITELVVNLLTLSMSLGQVYICTNAMEVSQFKYFEFICICGPGLALIFIIIDFIYLCSTSKIQKNFFKKIQGWVQYSCKRWIPQTWNTVSQIPIISARSNHEGESKIVAQWKVLAFKAISEKMDFRPVTNLLSIGDSVFKD